MDIVTLFLLDLGVGILIILLAIPMVLEKLKPNRWYGFRTKRTLSDEKIWYPANKYSGKTMIVAGAVISLLSIVAILISKFSEMMYGMSDNAIYIIWTVILMVPVIGMTIASLLYLKKL